MTFDEEGLQYDLCLGPRKGLRKGPRKGPQKGPREKRSGLQNKLESQLGKNDWDSLFILTAQWIGLPKDLSEIIRHYLLVSIYEKNTRWIRRIGCERICVLTIREHRLCKVHGFSLMGELETYFAPSHFYPFVSSVLGKVKRWRDGLCFSLANISMYEKCTDERKFQLDLDEKKRATEELVEEEDNAWREHFQEGDDLELIRACQVLESFYGAYWFDYLNEPPLQSTMGCYENIKGQAVEKRRMDLLCKLQKKKCLERRSRSKNSANHLRFLKTVRVVKLKS